MHDFRVFISTAENEENLPITSLVYDKIQECAKVPKEEIYFYRCDGNTKRIDSKVFKSIDRSAYFAIILDDNYFSSIWCFREIYRFFKINSRNFDDAFVIISRQLRVYQDVITSDDALRQRLTPDLICRRDLSPEEESFLDEEWVATLEELVKRRKFIDFRKQVLIDDGEEQLLRALVDPKAVHITRCARMAAFCLGADRFHDGGWGYSLGDYAEIDSGDGDRLPSGPYGMAIVGLRAIRHFLPPEDLKREIEAVFRVNCSIQTDQNLSDDGNNETIYERNPLKIVHDNLPDISNYISHLDVGIISHNCAAANSALSFSNKQFRWVIQRETKGSLEFRSVAYAAIAKSKNISSNKISRITNSLEKYSFLDLSTGNHVTRREQNYLRDHESRINFATSLKDVMNAYRLIDPPDFDVRREYSISRMISADAISCLEDADLSKPEKAIKGLIKDRLYASVGEDDPIDVLVADAMDGCAAARIRLSCFLADCAAALRVDPTNKTDSDRFLVPVATHIFAHENAEKLISKLDAIAWAAVIDIAFAVHWHGIGPKQRQVVSANLNGFWESGKALKQLRTELIRNSDEGQAEFDNVKVPIIEAYELHFNKYLRNVAEKWSAGAPCEDAVKARQAALKSIIMEASFKIGGAATSARRFDAGAAPADTGARPICGSLRVCADTRRVEIETPGYHKLFLEPFRDLTGMDVRNLSTISREFGDEDKTLVEIMGKMVVIATYATGPDGTLMEMDFAERTQTITEALKAKDNDDGYGMEDLMKLRIGKDSIRWVHRTAILQKPRAGKRTIAWRFAEVPNKIAEMCVREAMPDGSSVDTPPGGGATI